VQREPFFVHIAVEKTAPYLVHVNQLTDRAMAWGDRKVSEALEIFRDCTASGIWPGYPTDEITDIDLPAWVRTEEYSCNVLTLAAAHECRRADLRRIHLPNVAAVRKRTTPGYGELRRIHRHVALRHAPRGRHDGRRGDGNRPRPLRGGEPMTDIAIPDQTTPSTGTDLELWARQATAAAVYAERVCSTTMAPQQYRGKPAEAAAAILAGAELGFSPMASLRAFDNIGGTPAPKAMTLRAVVQAAGHQIRIVESTAERAVVDGRRKGETEWNAPSIWDVERAKKLPQFKSNPNYQHNLAAMLLARATAEQCRWTAADAIMGMPYAAEEITDTPAVNAAPVARRLTVADLDAPNDKPRIHPADGRELTPGYMADRDAARKAAKFPGYVDPTTLVVPHITNDQRKHMFALWNELGFSGEENREQRLIITAKILGLEELESSNELTYDEAEKVIAALRERKEQQGGAQ
jgi:hypothetical protein